MEAKIFWLPSSNGLITILSDYEYWSGIAAKLNLIDLLKHPKKSSLLETDFLPFTR